MRRIVHGLSPALFVALLCVGSSVTLADDDAKKVTAETNATASKEKLDFYRKRLREQRLFVEDRGDKPCGFVEDPLMRWDNPITQNGDGMMFLWTDRGRPAAVMNQYYHMPSQTWGRVFVSLCPRPMEMRVGGQPFWKPRLPGVSFKPLDAAKPPADKAPARLVQMRSIAKEFVLDCKWGMKDPTDWQLRLLPTPFYRYQVPEDGVVDGALFGYVVSGPEAVLMLEARQTSTGLEWQYSLARCTQYRISVSRHEKSVAEFPRLDEWTNTESFFGLRATMQDYPFGNPFANAKPADADN